MRKIHGTLSVTLMFVVSGCGGIGAEPGADEPAGIGAVRQAAIPAPEVKVNNTAAEPVPTLATGTTNVAGSVASTQSGAWNVGATQSGAWSVAASQSGSWNMGASQIGEWSVSLAGTPAVAAQQDGPWSVSLAGTPSVNIAGTPSVNIAGTPTVALQPGATVSLGGTATVQVGNTDTNPVQIRDTNYRAREPFQRTFTLSMLAGESSSVASYQVPTGKRLLIERASAWGTSTIGPVQPVFVAISTPFVYYVPMTRLGSDGVTTVHWMMNEQTLAFVEPNQTLNVYGYRKGDDTGVFGLSVTLSGYLVDL